MSGFSGPPVDTDGTLAGNSDVKVASQKAGKTYADTKAPIASPSFTGDVTGAAAFKSASTPVTAWNFDSSGQTQISILASASSADFVAGTGLLIMRENTTEGSCGLWLVGGGGATLIAQSASIWQGPAGTTTPSAARVSVAYSGTGYRIYNGSGATRQFSVMGLRTIASN